MNTTMSKVLQLAMSGLAVASLLAAGGAIAAGAKPTEAQLRYKQERADCMQGRTNQDRATCLKEAGAAFQEAQRGNTASGREEQLARNRLRRCQALPAAEREACEARMNSGTTSGSAQQGGVLREATTPAK